MNPLIENLLQMWQTQNSVGANPLRVRLAARLAALGETGPLQELSLATPMLSQVASQESARATDLLSNQQTDVVDALETAQDLLCLQAMAPLDEQSTAAIAALEDFSETLIVDEYTAQCLSEIAWPPLLPAELQLPALCEPITPLDLAPARVTIPSELMTHHRSSPMSTPSGSAKPIIKLRWKGAGPVRPTLAAATPLTREKIQDFAIAAYTVRVVDEEHNIDFSMMVGRDVVWREENGVKKQFFQFLIDPGERAISNVVLVDPWWHEGEVKPGWLANEDEDASDHVTITPGKENGFGEAYPDKTLGWLFEKRKGHPLRDAEGGVVWELEITDEALHDRELWYLDEGHYCTEFDDCKLVIDWFNVLDDRGEE